MLDMDDKDLAMICVTIITLTVIGVSVFQPVSPTVKEIVIPVITGLLGAALGRRIAGMENRK